MKEEHEILKKHLVRGTLQVVYSDSRQVVKEYTRLHFPGNTQKPWKREHNALVRLKQCGVSAPQSQGFERRDSRGVIYRREFIPGTIVSRLSHDQIDTLAQYIAAIHEAGVTICDPSIQNLVIRADGGLVFFDFCRARTFRFKGPLFFWYVGKEMPRIFRALLKEDQEQWKVFRKRYQEIAKYRPREWFLVSLSEKYWSRRWNIIFLDPSGK